MTRTRDAEPNSDGTEALRTGGDDRNINQQSTPPEPPAPSSQRVDVAAILLTDAMRQYTVQPVALYQFADLLDGFCAVAAHEVLALVADRLRRLADATEDEPDPAWICPNCNCGLNEQVTYDGVQPAVHQKVCSGCGMRYPVSTVPRLMKDGA